MKTLLIEEEGRRWRDLLKEYETMKDKSWDIHELNIHLTRFMTLKDGRETFMLSYPDYDLLSVVMDILDKKYNIEIRDVYLIWSESARYGTMWFKEKFANLVAQQKGTYE